MPYDPNEYPRMIRAAADRLQSVMRDMGHAGRSGEVAIWAVYTTAERDGYLHIGTTPPAEPLRRMELVRPRNATRWDAVPYSHLQARLADACRSLPILPIQR